MTRQQFMSIFLTLQPTLSHPFVAKRAGKLAKKLIKMGVWGRNCLVVTFPMSASGCEFDSPSLQTGGGTPKAQGGSLC